MPLANGTAGQPDVPVRVELFGQPLGASMYFPNISSSSSCNLCSGYEVPQPRNSTVMNPQYFNELSPRMNFTLPQMGSHIYWNWQPCPLNMCSASYETTMD
ncbi:hypothetical protein TNCT_668282 [Trichonephila clavata]|nr:hypothetical protein TNCT_668282 [Trichonephila clavata]